MTDLVHVSAPQKVAYTIEVTYWINRSQAAQAVAIQQAVTQAVEGYKTWQRTIGRDINPSKLHELMMKAGAKRLEIAAPVYNRRQQNQDRGPGGGRRGPVRRAGR